MHWPQVLVERRGFVKSGAVRRRMEIEYRPPHVRDEGRHVLDLLYQLRLGRFPVGVPWRGIGPAHRDQGKSIEVHELALSEADARGSLDDIVDLEDVVVAAVEDARNLATTKFSVSHVKPPVQRADHLFLKSLVHRILVTTEVHQLVLTDDRWVEAAITDPGDDIVQFLLRVEPDFLAAPCQLPAPATGDDGDHRLTSDVAAQHDHVGLVERRGVEEFPPADFRTMDIGGKENLHRADRTFSELPDQRCSTHRN